MLLTDTSGVSITNVRLLDSPGVGIDLSGCKNTVIQGCLIVKASPLLIFSSGAGIQISAGTGNEVKNTKIAGLDNDRYVFGIGSAPSEGNYFENDYVAHCITGIKTSAPDKYRSTTTTDCPIPFTGGN